MVARIHPILQERISVPNCFILWIMNLMRCITLPRLFRSREVFLAEPGFYGGSDITRINNPLFASTSNAIQVS
jgi:hypothetical protein